MEHMGYSIFLFIFFISLYRGRGSGGRGAKKMYYGRSEMANWQYTYMWFTLAESSKSLIQGRTKPIVPSHSEVVLKAPNKVVGVGGMFRPRDP